MIAGRIKHSIPKEGTRRSVADLMKSRGFSDDELLRLKRVLDATAEMNKIEQIAFAATQGLYNPETGEFVSDGPPRLDFASKLVNSDAYSLLKADLSTAVDGLVSMTDRRTSAEVAAGGKGPGALDPAVPDQHGDDHRPGRAGLARHPAAGADTDSPPRQREPIVSRRRLCDAHEGVSGGSTN